MGSRDKARLPQCSLRRVKEAGQSSPGLWGTFLAAEGGQSAPIKGRQVGEAEIREAEIREAARIEREGDAQQPSVGGTVLVIRPWEESSLPELCQWIKVAQSISSY